MHELQACFFNELLVQSSLWEANVRLSKKFGLAVVRGDVIVLWMPH
jgi:hypothetical protein